MEWRKLSSDSELTLFKDCYFACSKFHVSLEDLKRYEVYGFWDNDQLRGGYWLIKSPPYRCIQTLSPEYVASDSLLAKTLQKPLVEMGGLWKDKSLRGFWPSLHFFLVGMPTLFRGLPSDARVLIGYDHRPDYLRSFYAVCSPYLLYRGPIVRPGEKAGQTIHATICAVPTACLVACGAIAASRNLVWSLAGIGTRARANGKASMVGTGKMDAASA